MIGSRRLVVALLLYGLLPGDAVAEPIDASRGTWTGPIAVRSSAWPSGVGKIELRVEGSENRFAVSLTAPGESLLAGEFQASDRKGVFEPPRARGMMSLFSRGRTTTPLEGKPLAWSRREGDGLVVYGLELRGGPYRLDRVVLVPAGKRLELTFERREQGRPAERFSASLERQAP